MTIDTRREATDPLLIAVRNSRTKLQDFLDQFDKEVALEREAKSASLRYEIERSVVQAFKAGHSKSAIGRAYQTRDFGTIKSIVDAHLSGRVGIKDVSATFDAETNILTVSLTDAVLDGMPAAKGAPVSGNWDFHLLETNGRRVWASTTPTGKTPMEIQMSAWLNAEEENVLNAAIPEDARRAPTAKNPAPATPTNFALEM